MSQPARADARRLAAVQPRWRRPCLRSRRDALHLDGRRRRRRRPRRAALHQATAAPPVDAPMSATAWTATPRADQPARQDPAHRRRRPNSANGRTAIPSDNPSSGAGGARRGDLGLRLPQPVPLLLRLEAPATCASATSGKTTSRRSTSSSGAATTAGRQGRHAVLQPQRRRRRLRQRNPPRPPVPPGLIDPIAQYDTHHEGHSVIAGFVYRGERAARPRMAGSSSASSRPLQFPHRAARLRPPAPHQRRLEPARAALDHRFPHRRRQLARVGGARYGPGCGRRGLPDGNRSGLPFGTAGMVLKIVPARDEDHHHDRDD